MELKIKTVETMTLSDGSQYGKFTIEPLERHLNFVALAKFS